MKWSENPGALHLHMGQEAMSISRVTRQTPCIYVFISNITAKLGISPTPRHGPRDPPLSTNLSPLLAALPSCPPPKPYLVLRDTLRSCEAYGVRPT